MSKCKSLAAAAVGVAVSTALGLAPTLSGAATPASAEASRLDQPVRINATARQDQPVQGVRQYIVRLTSAPVARGGATRAVAGQQDAFLARSVTRAPGLKLLGRTSVVLNAVFVEGEPAAVRRLLDDPAVARIAPVRDYELYLSDTVPYIGAETLQGTGLDGAGVKVAVLDSGIDYTHAAFGGEGTTEAYAAAWGASQDDPANTVVDDQFPNARVVGGFDFVGEFWVGGPGTPALAPDPDPIAAPDASTPGGHGTHVADIIGGAEGVAPAVDLYAVKVCAATSSACSGIALIQGMEFSLDPNGDGSIDDRVDVINMSLGANFGQPFDDDLSEAVDNATAAGVLTVASAGNSGDSPYITGSPAAAPSALSVAQTNVPTASQQLMGISEPAPSDEPAVFQTWSAPLDQVFTGPVQYGDGQGGGLDGCSLDPNDPLGSNPFAPGSLKGQIVFVDRGGCFFSEKIFNVAAAGGSVGIIGLIAPGAPFAGGFGGNTPAPEIPGFMISQTAGDVLRTGNAVVTFDPANQEPLVMSLVATSSRGPQGDDGRIKPEIGAPGASVSAASGSGTGAGPFGGTSGAAPMVAGSAALLKQAFPALTPLQIKQHLINSAETEIDQDFFNAQSGLAPISRIGGGEVRVDRAATLPVIAYDFEDANGGGLSFGQVNVNRPFTVLRRTLALRNGTNEDETYRVTPTFRFEDDVDTGAVAVRVARRVTVPAGQTLPVPVRMFIDGTALRDNRMSSGGAGGDATILTEQEYDGYLVLEGDDHTLTVPWQVLPYKSSALVPQTRVLRSGGDGNGFIVFRNFGVGTAQPDVFSLLGFSDDQPAGGPGDQAPTPDLRAVGAAAFESEGCDAGFGWSFAFNAWDRPAHLAPVRFAVALDVDRDGSDDYTVYNASLADPTALGAEHAAFVEDVDGNLSVFFFAQHSANSGNVVLTVCGEQLGLTFDDFGSTPVDLRFEAQDFYFGGPGDVLDGVTATPGAERFVGSMDDVAGGAQAVLEFTDRGASSANSGELGLLVLADGARADSTGASVQFTEATFLFAPN